MTSSAEVTRRIVVAGQVQGVGYRYNMAREARRRSLRGWVRNRRDGTVEAVVSGEQGNVDALVAWARRGPPAARVSNVDVHEVAEGGRDYNSFDIVESA